jgi:glucuronate isomerase
MHADLLFPSDSTLRALCRELYTPIAKLPLICPHGHVDPRLLADENFSFGSPAELFIIPDHYVTRLLYSQGVPMTDLGVARKDGGSTERDHRRVWNVFASHWHLFAGTPSGIWIEQELSEVFGVTDQLNATNANRIYDQIADALQQPNFRPCALFARFNIEVLCTTDAATDTLPHHQMLQKSGWGNRVRPTFRPDGVVNIDIEGWRDNIDILSKVSQIDVHDYASFIAALQKRREYFRAMGATSTDHAAVSADTTRLSEMDAERIFDRALKGKTELHDAARFTAHMLNEMARMSCDDGLVMQLHIGSSRNHNHEVFSKHGRDMGADIPLATEFTRALQPLLTQYGNDKRFNVIVFTLDESTYSRELAPLAGHYPAMKLGPPWWFFDSPNGILRYFDLVMETCGIYNTAGFNDDTRAFASIPARHDVWRRCVAVWLAGLLGRHMINETQAHTMAHELAYGLAKRAYGL